ncbi:Beta-lactamase enzyme family protein [Sinosporangium album]|uniref:Beta-lactamase enzyme family protein n=1 Tax=Sinosporangium album TaxID=504805 RepID=A0A1G8H1N2_9ACTN|nr:serine hydrolase [Sinosporangium album]SDI00575.1 Beta-lactamase enzyme family protein [Sinosporangium album]
MSLTQKSRAAAAGAAAGILFLGLAAVPAQAQAKGPSDRVARFLQQAMNDARFHEVLDLAPRGSVQAARLANVEEKMARTPEAYARLFAASAPKPIVQQPQLDVTVLELDRHGRPLASGTVLMSPQHPNGIAVPVDRDYRTTAVRWRQWDDKGWYANQGRGTIDIVPGREQAPIDFMSPYPASVLKLMVGFGVLRLVDKGTIALTDTYDYRPTESNSLCRGNTSDTVGDYLEAALTTSDNPATCALIKLLHDKGAVNELNQTFQSLGLETLQLKNTNPATGGRWSNPVTMTSLDTAKLLVLINGLPGNAWNAPDGTRVTSAVLSPASRQVFKNHLADQGWNDMLSTANRCGDPVPGIPHRVPPRWVGDDGTVTVAGNRFGRDVRPCEADAEVTFSHKTGWVGNSGADAGIVKSLPGKAGRHYIVVALTNLGTQYVDANRPPTEPGLFPVTFTQKLARLGKAVDDYQTATEALTAVTVQPDDHAARMTVRPDEGTARQPGRTLIAMAAGAGRTHRH